MIDLADHLDLFKAAWIGEPELLEDGLRAAKISDKFTAELAAWCVEVHEQLRDLEKELDLELMLMGGNGASLRFDAASQRGSRDNDYLTAASPAEIKRLMEALASRFAALPEPLMRPTIYQPKGPVRDLPMASYEIPVPLRLNHGYAQDNRIKVEFHFETALPPSQIVVGSLGPAASPQMTARLPRVPYQLVIKLMTLAAEPIGIDEDRRRAAVPRQLYDLDGLTANLDGADWPILVSYCATRYAYECELARIAVAEDEPFAGIQARLARWADCLDAASLEWQTIRAVQSSQLQRPVHVNAPGWRARCQRLQVLAQCIAIGAGGYETWETALATAALVPIQKAKAFRPALAEITGISQEALPLELHDLVWQALAVGRPSTSSDLADRVALAETALNGIVRTSG